jgi:nucleoside-diphosphate-sugar epimerase
MEKILVTGSLGQIGSELVPYLRKIYGENNIIASDIRKTDSNSILAQGIFEELDIMNTNKYSEIVKKYSIDTIIHLAALLSATGEKNPMLAWNLNMTGLLNSLEICKEFHLQFFTPSSIAAFGPSSPLDNTPQDTIQRPTTMYGVTKVAGELLCDYYVNKYGVDSRGLRFPGLISNESLPGGGTTDYAVEIYYAAIKNYSYTSYMQLIRIWI